MEVDSLSFTGLLLRLARRRQLSASSLRWLRRWPLPLGALAAGIAWALGGYPLIGLSLPIFGLVGALALNAFRVHLRERFEQESSLALLRTLLGMLEGGVSLPEALTRLSILPGPTAVRIGRALRIVRRGGGLVESLPKTSGISRGQIDSGWRAVETAYLRGASASSALRRVLPPIEQGLLLANRIERVKWSALLQIGLALPMPWLLLGLLAFVEPEMARAVAAPHFWLVAVPISLLSQLLGGWLSWKLASFY